MSHEQFNHVIRSTKPPCKIHKKIITPYITHDPKHYYPTLLENSNPPITTYQIPLSLQVQQ